MGITKIKIKLSNYCLQGVKGQSPSGEAFNCYFEIKEFSVLTSKAWFALTYIAKLSPCD